MKRPSFQFYPADWRGNAKLRRCSPEARGAWMDILCVLHDGDEYGVCRWPLADIAQSAGVPLNLAKELAAKDVLKGADRRFKGFEHTPSHAGVKGEPITLIPASTGPVWFSSRMVLDEWRRGRQGGATRFSSDNQPEHQGEFGQGTNRKPTRPPDNKPTGTPTRPVGERVGGDLGDGATTSSSSSVTSSTVEAKASTGAERPEGAVSPADDKLPDWWPTQDRYGRVTSPIDDKLVYDLGKVVLGKSSGGQITKMLKLYRARGQNLRSVADLILQANEKSSAPQWWAGVMRRAALDDFENPKHELYPEDAYP